MITKTSYRITPQYIALCGNPTCGKSTAAGIIGQNFGHALVDDGLPLRQIAMQHLGLTPDQVFTQTGKLEYVIINGRSWQVRDVLGEIGNALEDKFGADVIPEMAMRALHPEGKYVFGSVRREQGDYYAKRGAMIIELQNPLAPPSKFAFDRFNTDHVHATIQNNGLANGMSKPEAMEDLSAKLVAVINEFSDRVTKTTLVA